MTRINLLKRKCITIDEFKSWLNELVANKKGALPDLNDWKNIKEMLDKVRSGTPASNNEDSVGYSILKSIDMNMYVSSQANTSPLCSFPEKDLKQLQKDMEYFTNKIASQVKIPKEYLLGSTTYKVKFGY